MAWGKQERLEILKALLPPLDRPADEIQFSDQDIPSKAPKKKWSKCGRFCNRSMI